MDIVRAKEIVQMLADGVDPATGEVLVDDSVYNKPEVIRALYTVLGALTEKKFVAANTMKRDPLRNAGKPWTEIEDAKLQDEFLSKMKISDIAKEHGRTCSAIENRLEHLNLKKKPFWIFGKRSLK